MIRFKKKIYAINIILQNKDDKIKKHLRSYKKNIIVGRERVFPNTFNVGTYVKISFFYFAIFKLRFCPPQ